MMGPIGHHVISYGNSDSVFTRRHSRVETNSHNRGADVAQLVELRTGTPSTQVRIPGAARDFSPRVICQRRLSYGVRATPLCNYKRLHLCAR